MVTPITPSDRIQDLYKGFSDSFRVLRTAHEGFFNPIQARLFVSVLLQPLRGSFPSCLHKIQPELVADVNLRSQLTSRIDGLSGDHPIRKFFTNLESFEQLIMPSSMLRDCDLAESHRTCDAAVMSVRPHIEAACDHPFWATVMMDLYEGLVHQMRMVLLERVDDLKLSEDQLKFLREYVDWIRINPGDNLLFLWGDTIPSSAMMWEQEYLSHTQVLVRDVPVKLINALLGKS